MSTGFLWDERFAWHDAGRASSSPWAEPYPALDRPESKRRLHSLVEASGLMGALTRITARPASEQELLRCHTRGYLEKVKALAAAGGGDTGESAVIGPNGYEIARLAAGGCLAAVEAVLDGRVDNAYALVRPAGHHAEPERGRGFCVFANVALAVRHARETRGVERVAVIDWDVHHGNGTELAFYEDPDVLTLSIHQDGCYPADSGGMADLGSGAGEGFNLNLPLPPGSGHGAYLAALERLVVPALQRFEPDLIVIACGFDAAISDPLGRMLCYSETYREMTARLKSLAEGLCEGRLVVCHEGGYSPTYVPFCGLAVLETLAGVRSEAIDPLVGWYARMGGQQLQPHQAAVIDRAVDLFLAPTVRRAASLTRAAL